MDFKKLAAKAKDTIDKRGGVDSLKADAEELKKVAKGGGGITDKAKAAAQALKDPGERRKDRGPGHEGGAAHQSGAAHESGEKHPAQHAGNPEDTPRKGGAPYS
jgi:hypothetical protein